jgi:hypothetical protein
MLPNQLFMNLTAPPDFLMELQQKKTQFLLTCLDQPFPFLPSAIIRMITQYWCPTPSDQLSLTIEYAEHVVKKCFDPSRPQQLKREWDNPFQTSLLFDIKQYIEDRSTEPLIEQDHSKNNNLTKAGRELKILLLLLNISFTTYFSAHFINHLIPDNKEVRAFLKKIKDLKYTGKGSPTDALSGWFKENYDPRLFYSPQPTKVKENFIRFEQVSFPSFFEGQRKRKVIMNEPISANPTKKQRLTSKI